MKWWYQNTSPSPAPVSHLKTDWLHAWEGHQGSNVKYQPIIYSYVGHKKGLNTGAKTCFFFWFPVIWRLFLFSLALCVHLGARLCARLCARECAFGVLWRLSAVPGSESLRLISFYSSRPVLMEEHPLLLLLHIFSWMLEPFGLKSRYWGPLSYMEGKVSEWGSEGVLSSLHKQDSFVINDAWVSLQGIECELMWHTEMKNTGNGNTFPHGVAKTRKSDRCSTSGRGLVLWMLWTFFRVEVIQINLSVRTLSLVSVPIIIYREMFLSGSGKPSWEVEVQNQH